MTLDGGRTALLSAFTDTMKGDACDENNSLGGGKAFRSDRLCFVMQLCLRG